MERQIEPDHVGHAETLDIRGLRAAAREILIRSSSVPPPPLTHHQRLLWGPRY